MAEITKNMKISDILALNELMAPFLMQNGLSCVTCAASQAESLEEACEVHGSAGRSGEKLRMERAERRECLSAFLCFGEGFYPIKVVLSMQGKSGMMREKSSG